MGRDKKERRGGEERTRDRRREGEGEGIEGEGVNKRPKDRGRVQEGRRGMRGVRIIKTCYRAV